MEKKKNKKENKVKEKNKDKNIKEVTKENNELKRQNNFLTIVVIIFLTLITSYMIYAIVIKDNNFKTITSEEKVYKSTIDAYGEAVTLAINNYIQENNGEIPVWRDIENDIPALNEKVSCDNHINYDGSIYLSNCIVEGISYTSNYTYGKKLNAEGTSDNKIYFYSYEYTEGKIEYTISNSKYEESDTFTLIDTYTCKTNGCQGYGLNTLDKETIIYDGKYYVYNYDKKIKKEIDLGTDLYSGINYLYSEKKAYALSIRNNFGQIAFYNLESEDFITNFIYNDSANNNIFEILDNNQLVGYKQDEEGNTTTYIISQTDGSIYKTLPNTGYLISQTVGGNVIYSLARYGDGNTYKLYDSNFELLIDDKEYYYDINSNNTITVYNEDNDKVFNIYDSKGNLVLASKEYKQIVKLVKDYIIILDVENNLKLLDLEENEMTTFLKVTDDYQLHPLISGWYTDNDKFGIYMVIEDKNIPYGTKGSGLEYYYIPKTKETGVIKTEGVGGYAKPVVYLYPTKKTNITVSFEKPYLLTTTYPKFETIWNVTAYPNGDLYDKFNKYYYGLYWEESGSSNIDFTEGFYVTKENAIDFLEEKTEEIGFTRREANEFIMYWLPILEKNEKNLVYFELTEERNNYNKININPMPDSLLRVAIHVKKVDSYTNIKSQTIKKFTRTGFTAVEWGGVEH